MIETKENILLELEPGSVLGDRYVIQQLIGEGGMAKVYTAKDLQEGETLRAVKILHQKLVAEKAIVERFLRESSLLTEIIHPNIVRVYDTNINMGHLFYVMEFISWGTLEDILVDGELIGIEDSVGLLRGICKGLAAIHEKGIIHRDIKPENICWEGGERAKIMDFGIAHIKESRLTLENQAVGTLPYIPPEGWLGAPAAKTHDIYSLGITMFEMYTGELPFDADGPMELMRKVIKNEPAPLSDFRSEAPKWLVRLVDKMLAKKVEKRFQSTGEILEFLDEHTEKQSTWFSRR